MTAAPSNRSARHEGSPYRGLASASIAMGLLFGVAAFAIAAVFMGIDYFAVRGKPTEHAVVIAVGPSGTQEVCGPRAISPDTPGERTTYRSTDPPAGLPREFAVNHCPDAGDRQGDVVAVRRTGTGTGQDDVYLDPIETAGQWMGMAGVVGVAAAVIGAVMASVKEGWGVHRTQRRIRRREARRAG